jgi:hypothetical protein
MRMCGIVVLLVDRFPSPRDSIQGSRDRRTDDPFVPVQVSDPVLFAALVDPLGLLAPRSRGQVCLGH